jgi:hypothetical protein
MNRQPITHREIGIAQVILLTLGGWLAEFRGPPGGGLDQLDEWLLIGATRL